MKEIEKKLLKLFFKKRFPKRIYPYDPQYFYEWSKRFERGHPDWYMDADSLAIYKKLKKKLRMI